MKVCIVKTSALGDIVQTFPVLSYLKQRFPQALIDWIVEFKHLDLVKAHPFVRYAVPVDTALWRRQPFSKQTRSCFSTFRQTVRQEPYDVVFDLQGNLKSGLLTSQVRSPHKVGFGRSAISEWPNMLFTNWRWNPPSQQNICADYLSLVQQYFQDDTPFVNRATPLTIKDEAASQIQQLLRQPALHGGPVILVSPSSAWRNKELPLDVLKQFLLRVAKITDCRFLFSWGSTNEHEIAMALHQLFPDQSVLMDRYPLAVLQNLMQDIDLVIGMDSLPLHLAASVGTPTFAMFGPSLATKYNPQGRDHGAFQGQCPYGRTFAKRCPILRTCPTGACLREQPADVLYESFRAWWERRQTS